MTQRKFRLLLTTLLNTFLGDGGDAFWLNNELSLTGAQIMDNLRCDLVDLDENNDPFADKAVTQ